MKQCNSKLLIFFIMTVGRHHGTTVVCSERLNQILKLHIYLTCYRQVQGCQADWTKFQFLPQHTSRTHKLLTHVDMTRYLDMGDHQTKIHVTHWTAEAIQWRANNEQATVWTQIITPSITAIRDVMEPAKIHSVGCGFHVQNPSDVHVDLSHDQNYQILL